MQTLTAVVGFQTILDAFRFVRISFGSHELTEQFVPEIEEKFELMRAKESNYQNVKMKRLVLSAKIRRLDSRLNAEVQQVARQVKVIVKGDVQSPLYLSVFPVTPSAGMKTVGTEDQSRFVRNIIHQIENNDALASLRPDLPVFKSCQEQLEAAVAGREAQRDEEHQAKVDRDREAGEACKFYNQLYPKVCTLFPDDKTEADTFFYTISRHKKNNGKGSAEEETADSDQIEEVPENNK